MGLGNANPIFRSQARPAARVETARPAGAIADDIAAANNYANAADADYHAADRATTRAGLAARGRPALESLFNEANGQATIAHNAAIEARNQYNAAVSSGGDAAAIAGHRDAARAAAQTAHGARLAAEHAADLAEAQGIDLGGAIVGALGGAGGSAPPASTERLLERMGLDATNENRALVDTLTDEESAQLAAGDGEPGDNPGAVMLQFARMVYGNRAHANSPALAWLEARCSAGGAKTYRRDPMWCTSDERLAWRASAEGRAWKVAALYAALPNVRPTAGGAEPAMALTTDQIEMILATPAGSRMAAYTNALSSACAPPVPAEGALTQAEIDAWNAMHPACDPATLPPVAEPPAQDTAPIPTPAPTQPPATAGMPWWEKLLLGATAAVAAVGVYRVATKPDEKPTKAEKKAT